MSLKPYERTDKRSGIEYILSQEMSVANLNMPSVKTVLIAAILFDYFYRSMLTNFEP